MNHFIHTRAFKICCGVVAVVIIFSIYNCIVSDERVTPLTPEQEEQAAQEQAAYKDTFDVVGDYLFPSMGNSRDELLTDDEKEGKTEQKEEKQQSKAPDVDDVHDEDFIESADISSDTKPAPPAPAPRDPGVEQLETPKITPVE